jgi:hypothetical protein
MSLVSADASDATYAASLLMWANFYRTQEALLRSPGLAREVLKELPKPVSREYEAASDPVRTFSEHLDIEKTESSYIMKVGFIDADPGHATEIVNTLVSLYLRDANRRLRELKVEALEVLSSQTLPAIRQRFDEAEKALQAFQAETGFADFEEQYASLVEARRRAGARLSEIRLRGIRIRSHMSAFQGTARTEPGTLQRGLRHRGSRTAGVQRATLSAELGSQCSEKHPRLIGAAGAASVERPVRGHLGTLTSLETNLLR